MALLLFTSIGGVFAVWEYAEEPAQKSDKEVFIQLNEFDYTPPMPEKEVTLLERIYALLNNLYENDIIAMDKGREYLLTTLDKDWDTGLNPALGSFAGSMDPTLESKERMDAMFGDIIDFEDPDHVSFILKSENLVGSIDNEIALYSTSDPLTWTAGNWMNTVVGVYLSVFIPVLDEQGNTIGYELLCESIHGYCLEVQYMEGDYTPSFSTDHWRDELFYWHENYPNPVAIKDEDRYKYECYHPADGNYAYPGRTQTWLGWIIVPTNQWEVSDSVGRRAWQCLEEILAEQQ
ncbi:MAG: hypothetical protein IKV02_03065 [Clostridia bacterium]|nr:hypothetical protein [Clostridia bacterium]